MLPEQLFMGQFEELGIVQERLISDARKKLTIKTAKERNISKRMIKSESYFQIDCVILLNFKVIYHALQLES